jgi:hypothetical protein
MDPLDILIEKFANAIMAASQKQLAEELKTGAESFLRRGNNKDNKLIDQLEFSQVYMDKDESGTSHSFYVENVPDLEVARTVMVGVCYVLKMPATLIEHGSDDVEWELEHRKLRVVMYFDAAPEYAVIVTVESLDPEPPMVLN